MADDKTPDDEQGTGATPDDEQAPSTGDALPQEGVTPASSAAAASDSLPGAIIDPDATVVVTHDRIEQVDLQLEMQRSFLDYAMSVIVQRALPEVRDGLKPVHRRVIYAMYDGGYRPDRSFFKSARVVGEVMGQFHPHGDSSIYDALVRLVQPWSLRYPLALGQGNFGSAGNDGAAAPRYTETKMAPLAMEMVRDITEDTVDFQDNYDGRTLEPKILPSRFPNLLVNGSVGIAVGMATNIPPHNLREVAAGAQWLLAHPDANREELLEALLERIKGPDFPTGAQVLGTKGIIDAYRTGRGSITMRAVVAVEEIQGRVCLVVTELPYQVNPDNLAIKIAELVKDGKLGGVADIRDETSGRTGQRLVIVLKRDAVAKVVLNNLYKHTQLQENFGANMLAIVDGIPRTLALDGFISAWVDHQIDVIVRRTQYRLNEAEARAHILRGYLKALDALDDVIALIRRSETVEVARSGLMKLLDIDELQANAILEMQLRRLAALERQKIQDQAAELEERIAEYKHILATPTVQREIISTELQEITDKYGDDRRTEIMLGFDGDMSMEDLIPEEEMVVTVTRGGYIKRTRIDNYRSQHRGGKGVRGAQLRADDVVEHFFVTTTHHWLLFLTDKGRVYRAKAYELQEAGRDAKGQHVANLLAMQPDEEIQQVLDIRDYQVAQYLVLATRDGLMKKTALTEYDTNRTGGIIAINLRDGDALVSALLVDEDDDLLLVSRKGMSLRFSADNQALRPMGRSTSGVKGMTFRGDDTLLSASVVGEQGYVFVVTEGGFAKRTAADQYRVQNRGGMGIKVAKLQDARGDLAGALIVGEEDEILVVLASGKVVRSVVAEVPAKGRDTMGVVFARFADDDRIISLAKNSERNLVVPEAAPDASDGTAAGKGTPDE
ncbi:DNA gyrase subunit A [Clavibacter michiganensis]|uniref:DNA gyrase subunit A n=1 Tax=Clavibacter michiganensis subsp. insidiosus TaxID=33014 RepID=A0A399SQB4_9MICO|nr:DNA gyrase subunit A [Clavibacter michiganensis]AWF96890.1 DNA gyrase subunit A [Clavibacter michiganensis subsp. insidiosus]AWF99984.1 DNA gyrase subunit A [Clavibacter michiganensis subsp. insidiosus]RII88977.1 DNA gyrase subunit A [Clavibacter michiganensis subsp. insidiosus]RIJ45134.1 DNA gyrase subunit A [Clavibacter michiganensis subsp. insidiosus]RMC86609.1 DNA gyrase subunit A [Clavibacter michiganensis subsp. insidiosus]